MRKLYGGFCKVIGEKHVRLMVGGSYSEECIADSIRSKETIRNTFPRHVGIAAKIRISRLKIIHKIMLDCLKLNYTKHFHVTNKCKEM